MIVGWLIKYEAVAVWLEGLALVAIFIWDRLDANRSHKETVAQLKIAQDQIKISQHAERAWILTDLDWPVNEPLTIVTGTSQLGEEPPEETTDVFVTLRCRNEGRSPAWVEHIHGHAEIGDRGTAGYQQQFGGIGPIAPGGAQNRNLHFVCSRHVKDTQFITIFLAVEYRDVFEQERYTTCGYTVVGTHLSRQEDMPERNRNT